MPQRCATVGCPNDATTCIEYTFPGARDVVEHDHVCGECADDYGRRPTLQMTIAGRK
jgi:hypothetical protein